MSVWQIKLAGLQTFLKKIKPKDEDCSSFRAEAKVLLTDEVLDHPGGLVKFVVPFSNNDGEYLGVVTEEDFEYDAKHRVYHCKCLYHCFVIILEKSSLASLNPQCYQTMFRSFVKFYYFLHKVEYFMTGRYKSWTRSTLIAHLRST